MKLTRPETCKDKKVYENKAAARFFAQADGLRCYQCNVCNHWHLTSSIYNRKIK